MAADALPEYSWYPARLLQAPPHAAAAAPHAVVVLNQPLTCLEPIRRIWTSATFRAAADGGANQLVEARDGAGLDFKELDVIVGDLDSLTASTRAYFAAGVDGRPGTEVIHDGDQYSTDFTKAVKLVRQRCPGADIVALGSLGGRVDQGVSQLHHLYLFDEPRRDAASGRYRIDWGPEAAGRTFLLTSDSLSFLLRPGRHHIHVRERRGGAAAADAFAKHVGILPMQGPSRISTRGLEWDVADWPTEFGGQMSTSNHVLPETQVVEVQTDRSVVFTIALREEWQGR